MAVTLEQSRYLAYGGNRTNAQLAFLTNTTEGNVVVAVAGGRHASAAPTITGVSPLLAGFTIDPMEVHTCGAAFAEVGAGDTSRTWQMDFNDTVNDSFIWIGEFSGMTAAILDVTADDGSDTTSVSFQTTGSTGTLGAADGFFIVVGTSRTGSDGLSTTPAYTTALASTDVGNFNVIIKWSEPADTTALNPQVDESNGPSRMGAGIFVLREDSTGDATATPAVVTVVVDLPAPTAAASSTASPAVTTVDIDLPTPTTSASSTASPSVIDLDLDLPAPVASASATAAPAVVDITVDLPTPTVTADAKITVVAEGSATEPANTTPITVPLDTIDYEADDVALILFKIDDDSANVTGALTVATGYTEQAHLDTTGGRDMQTYVWSKQLTASEANPVLTVDAAEIHTALWLVLRSTDATTPIDATTVTNSGQNDPTPTAPAITTNTDEAAVVTFHSPSHNDITTAAAPTGYTLGPSESGTNHAGAHAAYLLDAGTAGTKSPGDWQHTTSASNAEFHVITMALRYSGAAAPSPTPAVIDVDIDLPTPTVTSSATATPAVTTIDVDLPAATAAAGAAATPVVLDVVVDLPTPTVSTSGSATATPATTDITLELPTPTIATGTTAAPTVTDVLLDLPTPTVDTTSAATPATTTILVDLPAATITSSAATAPTVITITIDLPTPFTATPAETGDRTLKPATIIDRTLRPTTVIDRELRPT